MDKRNNSYEAKENRKYKSSMFTDLYMSDEKSEVRALELYNSLHDEQLPSDTKISKIRVERVLYMNFENDSSFRVDDKMLIFSEQQSTINENMPLRGLMYIGRAYEQLVPVKERYKKLQVKIPKPEFYTFYNGPECDWKEKTLTLSSAYKVQDGKQTLELFVKVININPKAGHELLDRCPTLREYGEFVDTVRQYQSENDENAMKKAIEECINRGILVDYLQRRGSEVVNMLIAEYDYDMDIAVQRQEAAEAAEKKAKAAEERADAMEAEKAKAEAEKAKVEAEKAKVEADKEKLEVEIRKLQEQIAQIQKNKK